VPVREQPSAQMVVDPALLAFRLKLAGDSFEPSRLAAALPFIVSRRVSFEISSSVGEVSMGICASAAHAQSAAASLTACSSGIAASPDTPKTFVPPVAGWRLQTRLSDALPLIPASDKQFDLPTALLRLLSRAEAVSATFQVVAEPFNQLNWREGAMLEAERLTRPEPTFLGVMADAFLGVAAQPMPSLKWLNALQQDAYAKAAAQFLFRCSVRFVASGQPASLVRKAAMQALHLVMAAFAGGPNGLVPAAVPSAEQLCDGFNRRSLSGGLVFRAEELAALWHPPAHVADAAWLRSAPGLFSRTPHLAVPRVVPGTGIAIGYDSADSGRPIALPAATFRQQAAIIGATGTGKSTAALSIFLSAIDEGLGGLLLDVKGDLALDAVGRIPERRLGDVVFIDGADLQCGWSIDPMGLARGIDRDLSADILVSCFEKEFRDSWGVVIERLMKASVRALLEVEGTTLLDLPRFLRDEAFRSAILEEVRDEMVRDYFLLEFEPMSPARRLQAVGPVMNRIGAALESSHGRRLFGRAGNVDLADLKRRGGIVIARFPQGLLGERNANIFASLTVTGCLFAGMTLVNEPESSRGEWIAVCDEFQNYANASFAKAYSEGRSFGICVIACTQFLGWVPQDVRSAILANANTLICFRLGEEDAGLLGRRFEPLVSRSQLSDLDNFVAAVRTSVGNERVAPFTMRVKPPTAEWSTDVVEKLRETARSQEPAERAANIVPLRTRNRTEPPKPAVVQSWPDIEEEDA
jgi:hypothetical protein